MLHKELMNFHKPFLLGVSGFLEKEKNIGEWSVDTEVKISVFLIDSCEIFETKK